MQSQEIIMSMKKRLLPLRIATVLLCGLCLMVIIAASSPVMPVCAGTLSGDAEAASVGYTSVTARVEAEEDPSEEPDDNGPDDGPSDEPGKEPSDDPSGDTTPEDSQAGGLAWLVKTGDADTWFVMAILLVLSAIVIVADKIRRLNKY